MDFVPQNVHWLVPEEPCPCDIFLHFRGKFALISPAQQPLSFPVLEKIAKARYSHVYLRKEDSPKWEEWCRMRHPQDLPAEQNGTEEKKESALYGNKRVEYLSYVRKFLAARKENDPRLDFSLKQALAVVEKVARFPALDWYFQQFHEPPDLFHHSARVTYLYAAFALYSSITTEQELESLVFSALIHELSGNPQESLKTVVSQATLETLEQTKRPVPQEVTLLIQMQDELASGKGFPNNKKANEIPAGIRAFTLANHFDHYRLKSSGTRRAKLEQTKQQMSKRKEDYDPQLWAKFWELIDSVEVLA